MSHISPFWSSYGRTMSKSKIGFPSCILAFAINVGLILGSQMWSARLETDINKLWVNPQSTVGQNLAYTNKWATGAVQTEVELFTIQTVPVGGNVANPNSVAALFNLTRQVYDIVIRYNGTDYTTYDMCEGRSALPSFVSGCSQYSAVDFFSEGAFSMPVVGMSQYLLDSSLAYPDFRYMLSWAATADALGTTDYFGQIYDDQCVAPQLLNCKEMPALYVPYPYNSTKYGTGSGSLFKDLNTMTKNMTNRLPSQVRFRATWMKAKGILRGMMVSQVNNVGGTSCTLYNDPTNSQVPGKTSWSLTPCGIQPGSGGSGTSCGSATCSIAALDNLAYGNFSDAAGCGKCVGAILFWTQDIRDIQVSQSVSMPNPAPPAFTQGPLVTLYSGVAGVTNTAVEQSFFSTGAQCPTNVQTKEKRITTGDCLLMWDQVYTSRAQFDGNQVVASENTMRAAQAYMNLQTPQEPVLTPVPLYDSFTNATLDAIALFDRLTGTVKSDRDAIWRAVLMTGQYLSVQPVLDRHSTRPAYEGKTEAGILLAMSGVDNDFSIVQNATRVVMGGTTPDLDRVVGGTCQCTPGYSGTRCANPVDDGVCECGNTVNLGFPPKCVQDVLYGCLPFVGCMGVTNLNGFMGIKDLLFKSDDFSPLTNMLITSQVLGAQMPQVSNTSASFVNDVFAFNCEEFLPCVEQNFNWTTAGTNYPNLPSDFAPVLQDAGYFIAQAADLSDYPNSIQLTERALFLARRALKDVQVSGASTAAARYGGSLLPALVANDLMTLASNIGNGGGAIQLRGVFNTTMLTTPINSLPAGACPLYKSSRNTNSVVTLQQYFECFVDEAHKSAGHKSRRAVATGQTAWGVSPSTLKTNTCSSAITYNVSQTQCTAAYAGSVVMAARLFQDKQMDVTLIIPGLGGNEDISYAAYQGSKYLWAVNLGQPDVITAIRKQSFGDSDSRVRAAQDAAFAAECVSSSANYPPVNMLPADCQVVFNKVPIAANPIDPGSSDAKTAIGVAMVKYKLTGAVLGVCGTDALSRIVGGAKCWKDDDCNSINGGGTCVGLENIQPVKNVAAFGSILFTYQAQGMVNVMKQASTAQYREFINTPILAKKYAGQTITPSQFPGKHDLTAEAAANIQFMWRTEFIRLISTQTGASSGADTTAMSTGTIDNIIATYSEANVSLILAGYILMLVYAQLSLISPQKDFRHTINHSRGLVGMTGVLLVSLAVASGLGITKLAGYDWSAVATQILPYVMLGLGVNDVFVLIRTFPEYRDDLTTEEAAAQGLGIAANPMTFSNITNSCVFAIGILTGMPIIEVMAAQASIITAVNYFTNILSMPWLLSMDYERQKQGRADVAICIQVVAETESSIKQGAVARNVFNSKCIPAYTKLIMSKPGKVITLVYMLGLIIAGAAGVGANIQLGLSLADIAPSGSSIQKALAIRDQYFSFNPFYVSLPELDYSPGQTQQAISTLTDTVNNLPHVMQNSGICWTKAFMAWGLPVGLPNYNLFTLGRICDINSPTTNGNCGHKYNCTVVLNDPSILNGKVPYYAATDFYRCLEIWINSDALYDALGPGLVLLDPDAPRGQRQVFYSVKDDVNKVYKLPYSSITFFATKLNTNADYVDLIHETESVTNPSSVPPSYAGGSPIQYFDQYIGLTDLINRALGYGLAVVFGITFMAVSVVAEYEVPLKTRLTSAIVMGAIVVAIICMSVYEVWAFMTYADIKISAIPAISLIMSLGADVGFNVYFATTFATSHGTRDQRVEQALDVMMAPAFDGAITVFLGVVCLAFSPLGFIVKYFFLVWVLILWLGLTNAFVFLPVILSLVGPDPITTNKAGGGLAEQQPNEKVSTV